MKFVMDQDVINKVLNKIEVAIPTKSELGVLSCMKVDAGKDLVISATDLTFSVQIRVPEVEIESPGSFCVIGKPLHQMIALLKKQKITFSATKSRLTLKVEKGIFHFNIVDPEQFPNILSNGAPTDYKSIDCGKFLEAIGKVAYSASTDISRPHLGGISLNKVRLATTDGHRLSMIENTILPDMGEFIIPIDVANRYSKVFKTETLGVAIQGTRLFMRDENIITSTTLINGEYPDVEKVVPTGPCSTVTIKKEDLMLSLKRAAVLSDDFVKLFFSADGAILTNKTDMGESTDEIPCKNDGQDCSFGMKPKYLLQALERQNKDVICMEVRSKTSPVVIKDGSYVTVIMPRRG